MVIHANPLTGYNGEYYSAIIEAGARKNNSTVTGIVSDLKDYILLDSCEKIKYNRTCNK